jgi:predicted lipoprotein with Yx(FWY)xxD motif
MPTPDADTRIDRSGNRPSRLARLAAVGGGALLALTVPLSLGAGASSGSSVVKEATVGSLGKVLVTGGGLTLYHFTQDTKNTATCTGGCATEWPPLFLAKGVKTPVGGPGVKGLGTAKWADGKLQVTFHGEPLYRFVGDTAAGQAKGENVGGTWFVVKTTAATTTKKSSAPSGGYGY